MAITTTPAARPANISQAHHVKGSTVDLAKLRTAISERYVSEAGDKFKFPSTKKIDDNDAGAAKKLGISAKALSTARSVREGYENMQSYIYKSHDTFGLTKDKHSLVVVVVHPKDTKLGPTATFIDGNTGTELERARLTKQKDGWHTHFRTANNDFVD